MRGQMWVQGDGEAHTHTRRRAQAYERAEAAHMAALLAAIPSQGAASYVPTVAETLTKRWHEAKGTPPADGALPIIRKQWEASTEPSKGDVERQMYEKRHASRAHDTFADRLAQ